MSGASVVINHVDKESPPVNKLCQALGHHVPHAFANMYLTPPNSQAVHPHSDDRDVLLLQVWGEKEWKERDGALYHVSLRIVSILAHKTLVAIAQKGDSVWVPRLFCKAQRRRMSEIQEEEEVTAAIMRRVRVLKPGEQRGCLMRWKCSGWPRVPGMGFSLWKSSISNEWRLGG